MARKTDVPNGLRHIILQDLNAGMSHKQIATRFHVTNKAIEQYIFENFRQDGWTWRYK